MAVCVNFNGPLRVRPEQHRDGKPASALFLDGSGNPVFEPLGADLNKNILPLILVQAVPVYNGFTGCGANHLASSTGRNFRPFVALVS